MSTRKKYCINTYRTEKQAKTSENIARNNIIDVANPLFLSLIVISNTVVEEQH